VYIGDNGTFTMSGGAISENYAAAVVVISPYSLANSSANSSNGGGVYVGGNGTFTMNGGAVSGNSADSTHANGGGVYVGGKGTFTMSGGAVSENSASNSTTTSSYYSYSRSGSAYGGGIYVGSGTFIMSGGIVSENSASAFAYISSSSGHSGASAYGGGVYVGAGTFTMSGGAVSGNYAYARDFSDSSYSSSRTAYANGGGVYFGDDGTFTMSDGAVSGNSTSASSSEFISANGGGVYVDSGTFTMNGGAVSGNSGGYGGSGGGVFVAYGTGTFTMNGGAVSGNSGGYGGSGGGVCVDGGTFTMNGGTVSGNSLSDTGTGSSYGREVLLSDTGIFKMSGDARPERVFLNSDKPIIISGALNGGTVSIDLGITSNNPLTGLLNKPVLGLDSSYPSGNLASLKEHFTLGNAKMTVSPYTETPISANYVIGNDGRLGPLSPPPPSDVTYSGTWTQESDGRRKSPAINDGGITKERVSFTSATFNVNIRITLDVSSESGYDYAFISTLDNDSATYDSGYYTGSRISGTASTTVTIPVPMPGSHFIEICYQKDGSYSDGSDCAWFKVIE
jgi:hypothetical protein